MFVAQSPGKDESKVGIPMIGESGKLFDNMMVEANMVTVDYFKTNINLCHPPSNRKTTSKEITNCLPWLEQYIEDVDPDIIVPLGDVAYRVFMPDEKSTITAINGNVFEREIQGRMRKIVPLLHPAFILRNEPAYRPAFVHNLRKIHALMSGEVPGADVVPFAKTKCSWEDLVYVANENPKFGFDLETDGPETKRGRPLARHHEIVGIGIAIGEGEGQSFYTPMPDHEELLARIPDLQPALQDNRVVKVASNVKFEKHVMARYGIGVNNVRDTLLEAWLLGDVPKGLKDAWHQTFGTEMIRIESVIRTGKNKRGMRQATYEDEDAVVEYAIQDPDASLRLHEGLVARLEERGIKERVYEELELPFTEIIVAMESNGFGFDEEMLGDASVTLTDAYKTSLARCVELAGQDFLPTSPQQTAKVLYGENYDDPDPIVPIPRWNPDTQKNPSTDKTTLAPYVGKPLIRSILSTRAIRKMQGTYTDGLPPWQEFDPATGGHRIHCDIDQTGTNTGRVSVRDPNLTNIPSRQRDDADVPIDPMAIRRAFVPTQFDYAIFCPDLSQIEMRIAADLSGDKEMIAQLTDSDGDIHSNTARKIFKTSEDILISVHGQEEGTRMWKNMRYLAKTIGFGVLYGLTATGLLLRTPTLDLTIAEATGFIDDFYNIYSGLKDWQDKVRQFVMRNGWYETKLGRRRYFPDITSSDRKRASEERNACVNMPVQGGAADYFKMACNAVAAKMADMDFKARLVNQVHDEIVLEGPIDEIRPFAEHIVPVMNTVQELLVPVRSDFECGDNWGDLYKWDEYLELVAS